MDHLTVVITGCKNDQLLGFAKNLHISPLSFSFDGPDTVGKLTPGEADLLYNALNDAAKAAWQDESADVLEFDSAFFPASATAIHPVRQLRGKVAARLSRRRDNLAPACASPGLIFGTVAGQATPATP